MSNSTHRVNIVRIDEVLPHPNADTLGIVYIGGYQVVVKLDDFKVGDLAIYIQPDTIVCIRWGSPCEVPTHHRAALPQGMVRGNADATQCLLTV